MNYGKNWGPADLQPKTLAVLNQLISMAIEKNMIPSKEGRTAQAILSTNPHRRLDRISMKLGRVEGLCTLYEDADRRVSDILKALQEEYDSVASLIHAAWKEESDAAEE